jgi:hypothetical protein
MGYSAISILLDKWLFWALLTKTQMELWWRHFLQEEKFRRMNDKQIYSDNFDVDDCSFSN